MISCRRQLVLTWLSLAKLFNWSGEFFLADLLVFLLFGLSLDPLPGDPFEEIDEDVAYGLHVVSAGLLDPKVGVDRSVTGRSSQVLVFSGTKGVKLNEYTERILRKCEFPSDQEMII